MKTFALDPDAPRVDDPPRFWASANGPDLDRPYFSFTCPARAFEFNRDYIHDPSPEGYLAARSRATA